MADDRWERADRLFEAALDLPTEERGAFLDGECGDDVELRRLVDRLLASAARDDSWMQPGALLRTTALGGLEAEADGEVDRTGQVVDRYRILRELGRGGMAVVYLAERADGQFEHQVALKLIKRGIDTDEVVQRFERERQILARIRHPNIARLLDGGTTPDGRPFFAMEWIDGVPIDRYCDAHKLSVEERLRLFLDVARAISHAHQNLIVHRDIKPTNTLVTAGGEVKLLDFGIARLLEPDETDPALTRTRQRLLTPAFASPEQVRGQAVTTTSDVYQLGVLLYVLLTGHQPYSGDTSSVEDLARAIVEENPTVPSTAVRTGEAATKAAISTDRATSPAGLRRTLSGDLDNIVLMALRKEPERRYASVADLIQDVERFLAGLPVAARADTLGYRTSKFVRRHTVAVALAATVFVLLAGLAATMTVQRARVARERDRANREARTAERVSEFLVDLFKVSDPDRAKGESVTAREILDTGARRIADELVDEPIVRAELMDTIGRVYQNLGLLDEAQPLIEQALELRRGQSGVEDDDLAKSLDHVAWLLENRGKYDEAEPNYRQSLALLRRIHGDEHASVAGAMNNLALLLYRKGEYDEAEPMFRQALEMRRRLLEPGDSNIGDTLNNLGLLLEKTGDLDEAEAMHREALEIRRAAFGEIHPRVAISLDNLGRIAHARKDLDEAERLITEALEMRRQIYDGPHPQISQSMNNLASVRFGRGDLAGAEAMFREVVENDRALLGEEHPDWALAVNNLAIVIERQERFADAEPLYRQALESLSAGLPADHWMVGMAHGNLGYNLFQQGKLAEAEREMQAGLAGLETALGAEHRRVVRAKEKLVELYDATGRPQLADPYRAPAEPAD